MIHHMTLLPEEIDNAAKTAPVLWYFVLVFLVGDVNIDIATGIFPPPVRPHDFYFSPRNDSLHSFFDQIGNHNDLFTVHLFKYVFVAVDAYQLISVKGDLSLLDGLSDILNSIKASCLNKRPRLRLSRKNPWEVSQCDRGISSDEAYRLTVFSPIPHIPIIFFIAIL